jgi:diacylglycerol kinase family enzyme
VANPSASGFTGAVFREVVDVLSEDFDVTPVWPNGPAETRAMAAEAAATGYAVVAAMGGDGVAHHVANGLANSGTALALIPAGTTNVLARLFDIPEKPAKAAKRLRDLPAVPTPMLHVATESPTASRSEYATFALGVGFDAAVVEAAERRPHSKVRFGGMHFATTAVGRLLHGWRTRPANLRVECDGDRMDAVAVLAQVHGPYTYFGKIPLHITTSRTGHAAIAAENLEVHRSTELLTRAVLRREIPERLGVRVWPEFRKLVIEADPPAPFQADGELLGTTSSLEVSYVPEAVVVLRSSDTDQS